MSILSGGDTYKEAKKKLYDAWLDLIAEIHKIFGIKK